MEEEPGWVPDLLGPISVPCLQQVLFLLSLSFLSRESENTPFVMHQDLRAPHLAMHLFVWHTWLCNAGV